MISAWWLIPAVMFGAMIGVVLTCLAVAANDKDKIGG